MSDEQGFVNDAGEYCCTDCKQHLLLYPCPYCRITELETEVAEERERGDWWRDRTTNLSREINGDLCGWRCEGTIKDGQWACNEHDMIREVKPIDPDWQPAGGHQ